eukprot:14525428-Alexandrium_andersonii.AAC.1
MEAEATPAPEIGVLSFMHAVALIGNCMPALSSRSLRPRSMPLGMQQRGRPASRRVGCSPTAAGMTTIGSPCLP